MLARVLSQVEVHRDPNVMVGYETADDAGVYLLNAGMAVIQTVDFFTPVVDDPRIYGQIAAANALSDIYAMGAEPKIALSIVGFPAKGAEEKTLEEILRGGAEKMSEAKVSILGGHSVQDEEIKFGYCVTGFADPQTILLNCTAAPGDRLILTKPLGTGIIATAIKYGKASPAQIGEAIGWMTRLNAEAAKIARRHEVHAATDITGYGLIGHSFEMAQGSKVTVEIEAAKAPVIEGVRKLAQRGMRPGGIETNRRYVGEEADWGSIDEISAQVLLDPQTSGGLLLSVAPTAAAALIEDFRKNELFAREIGRVIQREGRALRFA